MHVIHVGPHADPERRDAAALLDAWPALHQVPVAVCNAGLRVSVVQAAACDAHVVRDGVDFHFVGVPGTRRGARRLAQRTRTLGPDLVHLHGLRFPLHARALRHALPGVPIVAQDHADRAPAAWRARLERPFMTAVEAVIFTAPEQAAPFLLSGALRRDVSVITLPEASSTFLQADVLEARRLTGIHGSPCIAWVGRLHPVKDPLTALAAFGKVLDVLPRARLWCAFGDAPLLAEVETFIDQDPRLRAAVTLLGNLHRADVEKLLQSADVFLAASRSESTGFALIEAMACGAAPVVTDIPAFRTLTRGGRIGALFPVGDAEAAAAALVRTVRDLPARSDVRAHFERELSPAALGRRLGTAYAELVSRRHRLRVCLLVPGGVDSSGTHRVIPCILALIERLARVVDLHVLALKQEPRAQSYDLLGARVHCVPRHSRSAPVRWLLQHRARFGFDILHALWMHPQGTSAALAGALLRLPVLLHINGGDLAAMRDIGFGGRATLTGRLRLRAARAGALRATVPSDAMLQRARELGFDAERLTLGVPLDRWPVRAPQTRTGGELRLLSVGSLNAVKDHSTLLAAVALLRMRGVDVRLECVGEDTLRGAGAVLADQLGLGEVVRFHGFVPHDALRSHFENADMLVVSSRHEADPIAALEAAVAGVPVVGTAVGHLVEWAPDAARTCAPGDAAGLAAVIETVGRDETLRLRLARTAQQYALQHDADRGAGRVLEIYQELTRHA